MGSIERLKLQSECLKSNLLGDASLRDVWVYLPDGVSQSSTDLPTVYVLASYPDSGPMVLNRKPFVESYDERLDRLIACGDLPACIAVFPDCSTRYGGSQYLNSVVSGNFETFVTEELVRFVENKFPVSKKSKHRALVGNSSGGFGAISLGMRHPNVFGNVACHAGDMGFAHCYVPDFASVMIHLERSGGVEKFLENFFREPKKSQNDFNTINILAMASVYSPNPKAPGKVDLPFDLKTSELTEDIWSRWLAFDPVLAAPRYVKNLQQLNLFFDCGIFDEYRLFVGSRMLAKTLKENNIRHTYEEFNDGHRSTSFRFERSLKFFGSVWKSQ